MIKNAPKKKSNKYIFTLSIHILNETTDCRGRFQICPMDRPASRKRLQKIFKLVKGQIGNNSLTVKTIIRMTHDLVYMESVIQYGH